jgi:hypothetical protein
MDGVMRGDASRSNLGYHAGRRKGDFADPFPLAVGLVSLEWRHARSGSPSLGKPIGKLRVVSIVESTRALEPVETAAQG